MKKILLLLSLFLITLNVFSQHPIGADSLQLQTLGSSNTLVKSKAAIGSDSGLVNATYADTSAANRGKIKNYPGAQIRVNNAIWFRNATATKWIEFGTRLDSSNYANLIAGYGLLMFDENPYNPSGPSKAIALDSALLDSLVQIFISNDTTITQNIGVPDYIVDTLSNSPPTVTDGYKVLIGTSPTGAFVGHSNQVTTKIGGVWGNFQTPTDAQTLEVRNSTQLHFYKYAGVWNTGIWNRISVADLIGGITGIVQPDIGTIDSNSFTIKTKNIPAINIDANQNVSLPKYTGLESLPFFYKPGIGGKFDTARFKALAPGTNVTFTETTDTTYINATGGSGGSSLTRQVMSSGTAGTVTGGNYIVTIDPASAFTTFTVTLPASPSDLDIVEIDFGGTLTSGIIVTALTISPNSGQTILDNTPPTSATADNTLLYRYRASNNIWYRFKP